MTGDSPPLFKQLAVALRFSWRESRSGLAGFRIFIAVIALGVATIASVGSVADGLVRGIKAESRTLLGGDLSVGTELLPLDKEDKAYLEGLGKVSEIRSFRTFVRPVSQPDQGAYVRLKATDLAYPMVGTLGLDPPLPLSEVYRENDGRYGIAIDPLMALQYDLTPGDVVTIGKADFTIRALIRHEPDRVISAVSISQPVLISHEGLAETGLVRPGSLISYSYDVLLPGLASDDEVKAIASAIEARGVDKGWEVRRRDNAFSRTRSNIERFGQFMTLVGLATLIVGGVGVFNAIQVFVARKAPSVAILGAVGATDGLIIGAYLLQIMTLTLLAVAIGVAVSFLLIWLGGPAIALALNVRAPVALDFQACIIAALYGLLIAFGFAFPPLSRMRKIKPSALLRDRVMPAGGWPSPLALLASGLSFAALVALAFLTASDSRISVYMLVGTASTFLLLWLIAHGFKRLTKSLPPSRFALLRFAIGNIHRPDSMTVSVILSLGIGVTLIVILAQIEGNLRLRLTEAIPDNAPSFFFQNIDSDQSEDFDRLLREEAPEGHITTVPLLRGSIVALKGRPFSDYKIAPELSWIRGDRGVTYSANKPDNATLIEGSWWPEDYQGPPLVSLTSDVVEGFDLKPGDEIEVNVLGRSIKATLASVRSVVWESMEINFVLVFSPNTFAGAPHTILKTISLPEGVGAQSEVAILKAVLKAYPEVTPLRVKEVLNAAAGVVERLGAAITLAALVSVLASVLVLAGAVTANTQRRIYEAVILKTLGAEKRWLLKAFLTEFALLGLVVSLFSALAGTFGAWLLMTEVLKQGFLFVALPVLGTIISVVALTVLLGLVSAWRTLSASAASVLRTT